MLSWGSHVGGPLEVWPWRAGLLHGAAASLGEDSGAIGVT